MTTPQDLALTLLSSGRLGEARARQLLDQHSRWLRDRDRLKVLRVPDRAVAGWVAAMRAPVAAAVASELPSRIAGQVATHEGRVTVQRALVERGRLDEWPQAALEQVLQVAIDADDGPLSRRAAGHLPRPVRASHAESLGALGRTQALRLLVRHDPDAFGRVLQRMQDYLDAGRGDDGPRRQRALGETVAKVVDDGDTATLQVLGGYAGRIDRIIGRAERRFPPRVQAALFATATSDDLADAIARRGEGAAAAAVQIALGAVPDGVTARARIDLAWVAEQATAPVTARAAATALAQSPVTVETADALAVLCGRITTNGPGQWSFADAAAARRLAAAGVAEAARQAVDQGLLTVADVLDAAGADALDAHAGLVGGCSRADREALVGPLLAAGHDPAEVATVVLGGDGGAIPDVLRDALVAACLDDDPTRAPELPAWLLARLVAVPVVRARVVATWSRATDGVVPVALLEHDDVPRRELVAGLSQGQLLEWMRRPDSQRDGDADHVPTDRLLGVLRRASSVPMTGMLARFVGAQPADVAVRLPATAQLLCDLADRHGDEVLDTALAMAADWRGDLQGLLDACIELVQV